MEVAQSIFTVRKRWEKRCSEFGNTRTDALVRYSL